MKLSSAFAGVALLVAVPGASQGFGTAVAAGQGEVMVGEPLNERTPGYVYVFRPGSEGAWSQAT
ncbi:MAG TPA: hypothetical protein VMM83_08205, partial [Longimicrobiales bacterium]|nr:hypothetical protein [Longimicrobiales bacterium]